MGSTSISLQEDVARIRQGRRQSGPGRMIAHFRVPAEARKLATSTYDRHHTALSAVNPGTPYIGRMIGASAVTGLFEHGGAH